MRPRFKAPLDDIVERAKATRWAVEMLAPQWTAPGFPPPAAFAGLVQALEDQRVAFLTATVAEINAGAGCKGALEKWHAVSVLVVTIGRVNFKQTEMAPMWSRLRATGQGRQRILQEGADIDSAWQASDPAWVPKAGLSLAAYQNLRAAAEAAALHCTQAENALSVTRGVLHEKANAMHGLSVDWYAMASASFPRDSSEGGLVWRILAPRRSRAPAEEESPSVQAAAA